MQIRKKLKNWIKETLEVEVDFAVEHPADLRNGDYSTNVAMVLAGKEQKNPKELAEKYAEALRQSKDELLSQIENVGSVGGFINFYLAKDFFAQAVAEINEREEKCGESSLFAERKILIEHTQPNPFKEFHIGHLMNNAIGESVARLLKACGALTTAVGYHGDIGLHVAKAIWGFKYDSENIENEKGVFSYAKAYARGAKAYESDENAKTEITDINKKIYDKSDTEINEIYDNGRKLSLEYFDYLYEELDSKFEHHFYESETGEVGKQIVLQNIPKVFTESEGAVIFKGEEFEPKTHTRVFINSDGIPTYEAKEVGLTKLKREKYDYEQSITVTANEQDSFFDVVEVAIGEVFPELKGKLTHLSHGMLKLPSGKMSSRTGDVITAEALIEQVKEKVLEKIRDREFSEEQKKDISKIVSIGAIKYSILRQAIGGDIVFDFDKSISFEGDSGPYLQYTAVRANSVLEKAEAALGVGGFLKKIFDGENVMKTAPQDWQTTELEKYLYRFTEVVERAGKEYAPHHLVTYLTELAGIFNSFYAQEKIIVEDDPTSPYKIALTSATAKILKSGLELLGIKTPVKM